MTECHHIPAPPALRSEIMGFEPKWWCKLHRIKGHYTNNYYQLKKEIEKLIQEGHHKKYVKRDPSNQVEWHNPREREKNRSPRSGMDKGESQSEG